MSKKTSKQAASVSSEVLRSRTQDKASKTAAGSALSQRETSKKSGVRGPILSKSAKKK